MGEPVDPELTRKQRREQARAQRKAVEQAQAASVVRRTRLAQLGVVVAVVVVVIIVVLVATGGGGSKVLKSGSPQASRTASEVTVLIGGIPQSGHVLGSP